MAEISAVRYLAPTGSVFAANGVGYEPGASVVGAAFQFVVEAVGATPTITFKYQGSMDNVNWYDISYVTDSADTLSVATRTATGVGAQIQYMDSPGSVNRFYRFFRVVTSANTNITFRAELWPMTQT